MAEQGYPVELQAGFIVEGPRPVARHQLTLVRLNEIVGPVHRLDGGAALPGLFEPDLPPPR